MTADRALFPSIPGSGVLFAVQVGFPTKASVVAVPTIDLVGIGGNDDIVAIRAVGFPPIIDSSSIIPLEISAIILTDRRTEHKLELYIIVDNFLGVVDVVVRWSHDL